MFRKRPIRAGHLSYSCVCPNYGERCVFHFLNIREILGILLIIVGGIIAGVFKSIALYRKLKVRVSKLFAKTERGGGEWDCGPHQYQYFQTSSPVTVVDKAKDRTNGTGG